MGGSFLNLEDLRSFALISHGLWPSASESEIASQDAIGAVSLLNLPEEKALERAARALLEKSTRSAVDPDILNHPFYRLMPEERFLLTALHFGKWSYSRLGRILGHSQAEVADLAWKTRLYIGAMNPRLSRQASQAKPRELGAAPARGMLCPELNPKNPWTQKLLDDELSVGQRLFLQNHLMVCSPCHALLSRARDLYFAVEEILPKPSNQDDLQKEAVALQSTWAQNHHLLRPSERSFADSLRIFGRRPDVKAALVFGALILVSIALRS